jgi:hypothetical protein
MRFATGTCSRSLMRPYREAQGTDHAADRGSGSSPQGAVVTSKS